MFPWGGRSSNYMKICIIKIRHTICLVKIIQPVIFNWRTGNRFTGYHREICATQNINASRGVYTHVRVEIAIFTEEPMNQLATYKLPETPCFSEQRKNDRHEVSNLLAITDRGTGQILDINREGLSFGCLYPHSFPNEFHIDILDARGSHIKKLKVRKMRETNSDDQDLAGFFELVIGVEFSEISASQAEDLDHLLNNNIYLLDYYSYPDLL